MNIFDKFKDLKNKIKQEWLWRSMKSQHDMSDALFMTLYNDDAVQNEWILKLNFTNKTKKEIKNKIKTMTNNSPGRAEMLFLLHSKDTVIADCESINRPFDNEDIIIFIINPM